MNAPRFLRALLAVVPVLGLAACDRQAGTSDEHETTVAARLFQPDGSPASGARVRIYAVGDTSKSPREQVFASSDGSVVLPGLPAGEYNLVATDDAGHGIVIDSLLSTGAGVPQLRSDTLRPLGVIVGRLQVEPQHSPRIAWVQIMGIGLATNVDTSGRFRLEVPAGRITLAALTRDEDYTPTFRAVRTISDSILDIGTVRLEYTGIPVVEGLTVTYDTLNGVATVRWNRLRSPQVRGYVLTGPASGAIAIDRLSDTVFRDTLYRPESFEDRSKTREYAVQATDSARRIGVAWRRASIDVPSPWIVPRKGFRIDSLGKMPTGAWGYDDLDTLAEGLVSFRERALGFGLSYLHRADTTQVRFSRDGTSWSLLPIPVGTLRTVAWKGMIWVARGIPNGERSTFKNGDGGILKEEGGRAVEAPRYHGVRIEAWSTSGILERIDTILDRKGALLYRLAVVSDTLVLSRDSAAYGSAGISTVGVLPIPLGTRRLAASEGSWSLEVPRAMPSEWTTNARSMMSVLERDPFSLDGAVILAWKGLEWTGVGGPGLFARRPGERFAWRVTDGNQYSTLDLYRGNGEIVPPFILWRGCALQVAATGLIAGVCPTN